MSNSLFTGGGIEKKSRTLLACLVKGLEVVELPAGGLSSATFFSSSSGGIEGMGRYRIKERRSHTSHQFGGTL